MTYCTCGHAAQLHTPTGRMDDTTERGHGRCAARCECDSYSPKEVK